jgi:hypothetical protein
MTWTLIFFPIDLQPRTGQATFPLPPSLVPPLTSGRACPKTSLWEHHWAPAPFRPSGIVPGRPLPGLRETPRPLITVTGVKPPSAP